MSNSVVEGDSSSFESLLNFSYAYGKPAQALIFRQVNEDFLVYELLDFSLSGSGEHLWLKIKKDGENTHWIARKLANYFQVNDHDVGYAGMKDRHAITEQWFSVYLPGKKHSIDWRLFVEQSEVKAECLEQYSHEKKLKRGMHKGNRFRVRLRDVQNSKELEVRLRSIAEFGVPNYYGEQRFGIHAGNLAGFSEWVNSGRAPKARQKKSLLLSAARSYIFNSVLSARVAAKNWQELQSGDVASFDGLENLDSSITGPSGPLCGRGRPLVSGDTEFIEKQCISNTSFPKLDLWLDKLEHSGLKQERRPLVLRPQKFLWRFVDNNLELDFCLSPGEFATSVLRELAELHFTREKLAAE